MVFCVNLYSILESGLMDQQRSISVMLLPAAARVTLNMVFIFGTL